MKTFLRLFRLVKPFTRWVLYSVFLGSATTVSSIGLLGTSSYLISMAALQPSIAELQVAIVGVRFFGIARGFFRYIERLASHDVTFRLLADLRYAFYQGVERITPSGIQGIQSGDLHSRATADIDILQNFYVRVLAPPLTALIITIGVGLFTGATLPIVGETIAAGMFCSGIIVSCLGYYLSNKTRDNLQLTRGNLNEQVIELLQGSQELIAMGAEHVYLAKVADVSKKYAKQQLNFNLVSAVMNGLNSFSANITLWIVLIVGIPAITLNKISSIELAIFAMITLASFEVIAPLGQTAQHLENSIKAGRRLFLVTDAVSVVNEKPQPFPEKQPPFLEMKNITFSHSDSKHEVLKDFSLTLPFGKRIALVGPNGSGKTTVLQLLERFYEINLGEYLLNNQPVQEFSAESVRQLLTVLPANPYIFQGTVRANLQIANESAAEADMLDALVKVQLDDWLQLQAAGLDSWMGEMGTQLSGGELQRFGLARCILRDSPIWLLDEPTANLDTQLEMDIIALLKKSTENKSLVWITHNMQGMDFLDEIIYLQDGYIMEKGKEEELLRIGKFYRQWCNLQHLESWEITA